MTKGIVSVYCNVTDCKFCYGGRCSAEGITIDADRNCEEYQEACEHPDSKNGICLLCGEEI